MDCTVLIAIMFQDSVSDLLPLWSPEGEPLQVLMKNDLSFTVQTSYVLSTED